MDLSTGSTQMLMNPDLEVAGMAAELRSHGRVLVPELLEQSLADRLETCLHNEVPWDLAYHLDGASQKLENPAYTAQREQDRRTLLDQVVAGCRDGFSFAYETYMMVPAYLDQRAPELLLHPMVEFLNSPAFLKFSRELTGDESIRKLDAQATCYRPGHFLRSHDDREESEGRLYAYVLGLTRRWVPDWGGLLQFLDGDHRVIESFIPKFNSLAVFRVPASHCVSLVAPWAEAPRYSITGWMRI